MSTQGWFQIPNFQFPNFLSFVPNLSFLSTEEVRNGAMAIVQVALIVAGVANGIFTVQYIAKDERLPAVTSGATCIACLSGAQLIEELKQFRTLAAQIETLGQTTQRLEEHAPRMDSLLDSLLKNSTDITEAVARINTEVRHLEDLNLSAIATSVDQIKNLLGQLGNVASTVQENQNVLSEIVNVLRDVKNTIVRTSEANEREREALTQQREQLQRDQIKFAAMTTMAITIAQRPEVFQQLPAINQRLITNFWENHTGIDLNQRRQPA